MRIVVNHLTRMTAPRICVAGIDPATMDHIRPTTSRDDLLTRKLLRAAGGPFRVGGVVDLGEGRLDPSPPEAEDYRIRTGQLRHIEDLSGPEYLALLDVAACSSVEEGFGPELQRVGKWKLAVEAGKGTRSLAVIRPHRRPRLEIDGTYGNLQLRFADPDPPIFMRVTDVRFYEPDQTIRKDLVADVAKRLRTGVEVFLMLGLGRAVRMPNDDRERHWLQLNGICLADRPVGDQP